jgi:hypothetical protein
MTEKQNKPLFTEVDMGVTLDLVDKIQHDVIDLIGRTLEISPPPPLPIIISAGSGAVGYLSYYLENQAGIENPDKPDRKSVLLAALVIAYTTIHKDPSKVFKAATSAADLLIKKGMI